DDPRRLRRGHRARLPAVQLRGRDADGVRRRRSDAALAAPRFVESLAMARRASSSADPAARVAWLTDEIRRHDRLYYDLDKPEISDPEYDALLRELRDLEAAHPELLAADSPTQRVRDAAVSGLSQAEHRVPMLSLENTYDDGEVREWAESIAKFLGVEPGE